ncbi:HAD-IA family hydrolase [uncultured Roseobacter sp.]|uniref:HAD family hydrolase n=1 Tax=uncultured Roseobacter sp. TaxID=114847 RepID=UPI0026192206|nr:HAD-IA family hydrolase [uncultured Roseobacter sp.]
MPLKAVFFGSIGTLVETSELQRQAFNQAFAEAGLEWDWDLEDYKARLAKSGGRRRIEDYARERDIDVDAERLHARKTEIFDAAITARGLSLRPGVSGVVTAAKEQGIRLGFVTTTSRQNVDAVFAALAGDLSAGDFDFGGDATMVDHSKPAPDIYRHALDVLALAASDCIAIEDTPVSMKAARSAGIDCVAFPGDYADRSDFPADARIMDRLSAEALLR